MTDKYRESECGGWLRICEDEEEVEGRREEGKELLLLW